MLARLKNAPVPVPVRAAVAAVLSLLFVFALYEGFLRPTDYQVRVSDSMYDLCVAELSDGERKGLPFSFVRDGDFSSRQGALFGPRVVTAAALRTEECFSLVPPAISQGERLWALSSVPFLPSVPADFTDERVRKNPLLSPELSLSLSDAGGMPEGNRALPVDGVYAGSDGYPLNLTRYAVRSIFVPAMEKPLDDWIEAALKKN